MEVNVKEIDSEIEKNEEEIEEYTKMIEDAEASISDLNERIENLKHFKNRYQELNEDYIKLFGDNQKHKKTVSVAQTDENEESEKEKNTEVEEKQEDKKEDEEQESTVLIGDKSNEDGQAETKVVLKTHSFKDLYNLQNQNTEDK